MASEAGPGSRTRDTYTVGWICALPKEQTAATAMLDHRHADLLKPPNDPNIYTLGSIGQHNVVIACLPKSKVGTSPAATVAAWMISTFPSIRVGLMVGIGGGVPPKVRLGDVVVSTPVGQFPGVVQWDFGKAKEGGGFERTGSLNNPPTLLLSALTKLETEHELNGSKISEYINDLKEKWPRLVSKYLKSDSLEDLLFRADYGHISESANGDITPSFNEGGDEESCEFCDRSQIIKKKPRDMRVHYGLIASGNQVIKDAIFRDGLNKDFDGQVLCVDMEAAGLMNNFPCIVIRGICDYADSHKNKDWQEYAAVMAAAFAKELLGYVPTTEVEREPPVKDILGEVLDAISTVGENTAHTKAKLDRMGDVTILNWVTPFDYGPQQSDYFQRQQPGTGQWILDSEEFQTWLDTNKETLFCPGMPGAGKTILSSIVVDHLTSKFHHENIGIAYIYCNFRRQHEQKIDDLLASLLKQLAETYTCLPEDVRKLHQKHEARRTRPTLDELYKALQSTIALHSRVFIIIDALDECQASNSCRTKLLSQLFELQTQFGINIFATSRPVPEVTEHFKQGRLIEIRAHDDDVEKYLDSQISQSGLELLDICRVVITRDITKAVDGMFLLAQLYFEFIRTKRTQKKIKDALRDLATGKTAYDYAYKEAMERIMSQDPDSAELAKLVLSWILCSTRPLKTLELQHALAVEIGKYKLDKENILKIKDMISVCSGLITIDEESDIIRLIHYTTQEYFERTQNHWFPKAESTITTICVTYLSFNIFENGPDKGSGYDERRRLFPLTDYAASNWGHHARKSQLVGEETMNFLNCEAKLEAAVQVIVESRDDFPREIPYRMTGLHLAAYFGISEVAYAIIQHGTFTDPRDNCGRTPLSYAAENGHENIIKMLLAMDEVNPNSKDIWGISPLSRAATVGNEAAIKLLLSTAKVDVESGDMYGVTPLSFASQNGHEAVVKLLLSTGKVDVNSRDRYSKTTPLSRAAQNGHEAVVRLLLSTGKVDVNSKNRFDATPLEHAARFGHEAVFKLLLSTGKFNVCSKGSSGWKSFSLAAEYGHEAIFKLLLSTGKIDADSKDGYHEATPLSLAAQNGHENIVKLLLSTDKVDADSRNADGRTPLSFAAQYGHEAIVKLLLTTVNVDCDSKEKTGRTPLSYAAKKGREAIVKLLLATGKVDADSRAADGRTPLSYAAQFGDEVIVELLLATGKVDSDSRNSDGHTPLSYAAQYEHEAIVKLLLTTGNADGDLKEKTGRTPLSYASEKGHEAVIKLLLAIGKVNPDLKDDSGRTPLFYAAEAGHEAIVELLLSTGGVNPDSKCTRNRTPLWYATTNRHEAIVKLLLSTGEVNPNSKCDLDLSPLLLAAQWDNKSMIKLLLITGKAKINLMDIYGHYNLSHAAVIRLLSYYLCNKSS